jgi:hypothetical protein
VKKKNRELFLAGSYKDFPANIQDSPYRWLLESKDSRSLYPQFSHMNGVKITEKPQINVDKWLDPTSPQYNPAIADAVFHYSARAARGDHFEACIATEEMNAAAWKYGHQNQIILDGTFGVCDSRLLLFIIMVVDENKNGVPVAFLIFSALAGNKQSSAGYNTEILTKLIGVWKDSLMKCGSPSMLAMLDASSAGRMKSSSFELLLFVLDPAGPRSVTSPSDTSLHSCALSSWG